MITDVSTLSPRHAEYDTWWTVMSDSDSPDSDMPSLCGSSEDTDSDMPSLEHMHVQQMQPNKGWTISIAPTMEALAWKRWHRQELLGMQACTATAEQALRWFYFVDHLERRAGICHVATQKSIDLHSHYHEHRADTAMADDIKKTQEQTSEGTFAPLHAIPAAQIQCLTSYCRRM
jgi:hypothetical protein